MSRIKSRIITSIFDTSIGFKLMKQKCNNSIIMYHGVSSKSSLYNKRHTVKEDFVKQLIFFKKHCNIINLDQFYNKEFSKNKINVAITFDDGYWNNYSIAKPILEELEIPATFFVTGINNTTENFLWADFIDIVAHAKIKKEISIDNYTFHNLNNNYINTTLNKSLHQYIKQVQADYETKTKIYNNLTNKEVQFILNNSNREFWQLMSDEEIKITAMSKYITIQSHGYYHNNLGTIAVDKAVEEIKESKFYLENLTQRTINKIGFPDGSYSRKLLDESEKIGVTKFVAAEGFLFEEDKLDKRILDRKGIYDVGSYQTQIYNCLQ